MYMTEPQEEEEPLREEANISEQNTHSTKAANSNVTNYPTLVPASSSLPRTHGKSFWVVPAPEAFSRHSSTCRLLGYCKAPAGASYTAQVGDFLRAGSTSCQALQVLPGTSLRFSFGYYKT
uniref:Uncharacterized protein n=1 Tax=Ditylum brightwellii TaxID=49249 RepID=A0A7S4RFK8_9STRA|mmetsp:Transcript_30870/g.46816  ORF Transcript_30870/g.46816 Transcript_30870/m.46816 type:complete len:121 (+) Transcript_30870:526-888(+)